MSIIIGSEGFCASNDIIGHLEYYEAIFEREGLVTREGEFRSAKLGLTLEILRIMSIPENLKTELISAIINAWRLEAPEKTFSHRKKELTMLLQSIGAVKSAANWAREHNTPTIGQQLDVAVMFSLPLTTSDLLPEDVSRIHELLCQVMDYYAISLNYSTALNDNFLSRPKNDTLDPA